MAGVIDSTTNFVEHPEVIAERLENVARGHRRSAPRDGGQRLRLRDHRGARPRRRGCRVGEVQVDGGGREARVGENASEEKLWEESHAYESHDRACGLAHRYTRARDRLEFLSSPVRAAVRHLARRQDAERGDREIDQRRTESAPASFGHAADRAEQHHAGRRRAASCRLADDLFNSGNIPVAGIPRLPGLVRSLRRIQQDRRRAAAVSRESLCREGHRDAGGLHLSAAGSVGTARNSPRSTTSRA